MESKLIGKHLHHADEILEFTCCVCLELLYKPIILACGHVSCFWCVHQSLNPLGQSRCPVCRHAYLHFPTICQMLHLMLVKMYPAEYKRREAHITEYEKEIDLFSPHFEAPLCKEQIEQGVSDGENFLTANGTCRKISVDDVLCTSCHELVYRPVVLNCGHVYCQSAIQVIKCFECKIAHPGKTPEVCLWLKNFLEEQFPTEYATRKLKQPCLKGSSVDLKKEFQLLTSSEDKLQYRVGCDSCGMFPIIGERYKCKDCVDKVSFDLCEDCYSNGAKTAGRFNQPHTPDHQFEIDRSVSYIVELYWK